MLLLSSVIFLPFAFTKLPLEPLLPQLKEVPSCFIYGEYDWVNRTPVDKLIESGLINGKVY